MDEYSILNTEENEEQPESGACAGDETQTAESGKLTLKHLDRTLSVDRDEVVRLAQKGLDYDRVKSRYSELKEQGAELSEQEPGAAAAETASKTEHGAFDEFIDKRPDISPEDIPQEVWAEVANGEKLLTAYTMYENKRLRTELLAERQNRENRETSVDSRSTEGSALKLGELERLWYSEG